jgi:hypothetical protein
MASGQNKSHHTAADFPASFDMTLKHSTIKLPAEKLISSFNLRQLGDDRIADYLAKGWSLGIVCKDCRRLIEWTPPVLEQRFGTKPRSRIADIAERLKCSWDDGCGSANIAVFPHAYDQDWRPRDEA